MKNIDRHLITHFILCFLWEKSHPIKSDMSCGYSRDIMGAGIGGIIESINQPYDVGFVQNRAIILIIFSTTKCFFDSSANKRRQHC